MSREAHGPCFSMASFFFKASANLVSTARVKINTSCVFLCRFCLSFLCHLCLLFLAKQQSRALAVHGRKISFQGLGLFSLGFRSGLTPFRASPGF